MGRRAGAVCVAGRVSLTPPRGCPPICSWCTRSTARPQLGYLKPGDQLPKVRDVVASAGHQPQHGAEGLPRPGSQGPHRGGGRPGTFIPATSSQVALPELSVLRRSLTRWLSRRGRAGLDQTASWRCLPASCGTSIVPSGVQPHPRRRGERNGGRSMNVIEANAVGKRYDNASALRELHAGHTRRARGPPWSTERRRQDHPVEAWRWPARAPSARHRRSSAVPGPVVGGAGRHRLCGPGRAPVQEPVGGGNAAPDPQPEPATSTSHTPKPG